MTNTFVKRYPTFERAESARAHYNWLAQLDSKVRMPRLEPASQRSCHLVFEHLGQHSPGLKHLCLLADALGRLHASAYTTHLHAARLDVSFPTSQELTIVDFISPRRVALDRASLTCTGTPTAFYKDANIRNFLLTDDGVAIIDFDDLTLAPFGYDLAKLIISAAMTYGRLELGAVSTALTTYNAQTAAAGGDLHCPLDRLFAYTEIHWMLTERYLGYGHYRYAWPDVHPDPSQVSR
jgi:hypothetical protein